MYLTKRIAQLEQARYQAWAERKREWSNPDETEYWKANTRLHKATARLNRAIHIYSWLYDARKLTKEGSF